jgi:hypothetical protein
MRNHAVDSYGGKQKTLSWRLAVSDQAVKEALENRVQLYCAIVRGLNSFGSCRMT